MLKGKCRYCGQKISERHLIVELLTAILFLALYVKFGMSIDLFATAIFSSLLIIMAFTDIENMIIPDILAVIGIIVGVAYSWYLGDVVNSLTGICFGFVFMLFLSMTAKYVLKKEAMGEGDIKLVVMIASLMGVDKAFMALFIASISGALVSMALIIMGKIKRDGYIPFVPYLALGAIASIFI